MEYVKKEELIKGEIYKNTGNNIIFKCLNDKTSQGIGFRIINKCFARNNWFSSNPEYLLATPEEKHWLNCCITADKFITFEEAMKTFIPEYVECTQEQYPNSYKVGIIYKLKNTLIENEIGGVAYWAFNQHRFKPSTKEAYDAQFVVKEPEFMLPEKWYILRTKENHKILNKWCNENKLIGEKSSYVDNTKKLIYSETPYNSWVEYKRFSNITDDSFTEINFEQFKKYVLKEETPVQDFMKLHDEIIMKDIPLRPRGSVLMDINIIDKEIIEPLPQFKVIETIETITKVENNEGNQFFIGDVVISDSGFVQTIKSFRYNVNKDNVLATTNVCNQISIARLEHYIEPKVEETLLEKAKRLYPIGTKVNSLGGSSNQTIDSNTPFMSGKDGVRFTMNCLVYLNGKWAEIIE